MVVVGWLVVVDRGVLVVEVVVAIGLAEEVEEVETSVVDVTIEATISFVEKLLD